MLKSKETFRVNVKEFNTRSSCDVTYGSISWKTSYYIASFLKLFWVLNEMDSLFEWWKSAKKKKEKGGEEEEEKQNKAKDGF